MKLDKLFGECKHVSTVVRVDNYRADLTTPTHLSHPVEHLRGEASLIEEKIFEYSLEFSSATDEVNENSQKLDRPVSWLTLSKLRIGLAFLGFVFIGLYDGALGTILPSLETHYHVDKTMVALPLLSTSVGYLLAAFSNALIAQRLGQYLTLLIGVANIAIAMVVFSCRPPFVLLTIAPLFFGFGAAMMDVCLNAYLAGKPNKTVLLNLLHACFGIGALAGPILASSMLVVGWGWNSIYLSLAVISTSLLVGFGLTFRRDSFSSAGEEEIEGNILSETLKLRVVWLVAFFFFFYVGAEVTTGNWMFSFLTQERQHDALMSGWLVSGYWLGITVGRLALAPVAARLGARGLINACLAGTIIGVLVLWFFPTLEASAVGLGVVGFCLGPVLPCGLAFVSNVVDSRFYLCAISFSAGFSSIGKAFLPWIAGGLTENLGLSILLPYLALLVLATVLFWLLLWPSRLPFFNRFFNRREAPDAPFGSF